MIDFHALIRGNIAILRMLKNRLKTDVFFSNAFAAQIAAKSLTDCGTCKSKNRTIMCGLGEFIRISSDGKIIVLIRCTPLKQAKRVLHWDRGKLHFRNIRLLLAQLDHSH